MPRVELIEAAAERGTPLHGALFPWPHHLLPTYSSQRDETPPPLWIPDKAIASLLGVHPRSITRWREARLMTEATADRLATKVLGMHPSAVWPEWWDVAECLTAYEQDPRSGWMPFLKWYRKHWRDQPSAMKEAS